MPLNTALSKQITNCNAKLLVLVNGNTVVVQKLGSWDTHCHSLDLMDQLQTNSFMREYIKNKSKRGYDHNSIYRVFQNRFDLSKVGAKYLTNAKVAQYTQFSRRVQQFGNIQTLLESRNYKFEIHLSLAGMVVVFANCSQLHQLITYGNELVLMDACGSLAGNFLVTLLIRNNLRCWIPCG